MSIHLADLLSLLCTYQGEREARDERELDVEAARLALGASSSADDRGDRQDCSDADLKAFVCGEPGVDESSIRCSDRVRAMLPEAQEILLDRKADKGIDPNPTIWEFACDAVFSRLSVRCKEHELRSFCAGAKLGRFDEADSISTEIEKLHREGLTSKLLSDIWEKYPAEATAMNLPSLSASHDATPLASTATDQGADDAVSPRQRTGLQKPIRPGPDFASVRWGDTLFTFTSKQRGVVKALYDAYESDTPDVSEAHLLSVADLPETSRLLDVFRGNPAWGKMIAKGARKDTFLIADPPQQI